MDLFVFVGSNSLLKRLYEQDLADEETELERHAFDYVRFWRYRVPITVSHVQRSLYEFVAKKGKSTCQILQKFLDKVCFFMPVLDHSLNIFYLLLLLYCSIIFFF